MNRLISVLVLLLTITLSSPSQEKVNDFYISGGLSFPSGPQVFSDYWKMGFNVGGGFGFPLSTSVSLIAIVDYNNFSFDEEGFLKAFGFSNYGLSITGGSASIFTVNGNIKILLNTTPNTTSPYIIGGLGFFSLSTSDVTVSGSGGSVNVAGDSESAFNVQFGLGIDIPTSSTMNVFIEGRYGIGFTKEENTSFLPIRIGLRIKI
jgi:opacity protein-like surface antigen